MKYHNSHGQLFGFLLTGAKPTTGTLWFPVIELKAKCSYPSEGNKVYWFFFFLPVWPVWDYSQDGGSSGWGLTANRPSSPHIHSVRHMPSSQLHIRQQQPGCVTGNRAESLNLLWPLGPLGFSSCSVTLQRRNHTNPLQLCVQTVWISIEDSLCH